MTDFMSPVRVYQNWRAVFPGHLGFPVIRFKGSSESRSRRCGLGVQNEHSRHVCQFGDRAGVAAEGSGVGGWVGWVGWGWG